MPTTPIIVNNPIAFVVQSDQASYDLFVVNTVTGVVTSPILDVANSTISAFLTEKMQRLLALLPGLNQASLETLIKNLLTLEQLGSTTTVSFTVVGPVYTLNLAGLTNPSNVQVTVPHSIISPFTGNVLSGGGGGAADATFSWSTRDGDGPFLVPVGVDTAVEFPNTVAENPVGAVTATNPWTFTCPVGKAGLYLIDASLTWSDQEGGTEYDLSMYVTVNGFSGGDRGPEFAEFRTPASLNVGSNNIMQLNNTLILEEGDTVQLVIFQNNDASVDLVIDDNFSDNSATCFANMTFLGPATFPI